MSGIAEAIATIVQAPPAPGAIVSDPAAAAAATPAPVPAPASSSSSPAPLTDDYDSWLRRVGWGSGLAGQAPEGFDAMSMYAPGGMFYDAPPAPAVFEPAPQFAIQPAAPAAPPQPSGPWVDGGRFGKSQIEGWGFVVPDGNGGLINPQFPGYVAKHEGRGQFNVLRPNQFGPSFSSNEIDSRGYINVTDFVREQIGGTPIGAVYYNPTTGRWANYEGRGVFRDSDRPILSQDVSHGGGFDDMLKSNWEQNWGPLIGAAMEGWGPALAVMGFTGAGPFAAGGGAAGGEAAAEAAAIEAANQEAIAAFGNGAGGALEAASPSLTGMLASLPGPVKTFGANLALTGDPRAAAVGTAVGQGLQYGAELAAPTISSAYDEVLGYFSPEERRMFDLDMSGFDSDFDASNLTAPNFSQVPQQPQWVANLGRPTVSGPASVVDFETGAVTPVPDAAAASAAGINWTGNSPLAAMAASSTFADPTRDYSSDPAVPEDVPPPPQSVTGKDIQRFVKVAQDINEMIQGDPEMQPRPREEYGSDAEYQQQFVEYLGLDAQTMADAGLEPGTPEYLDYILQQADAVIQQVIGDDFDMSAEELSTALRDKTQEELRALQRALYVRGQLGQQGGSGTYTDPVSGADVEVIGNGMFNPGVGAYQRGIAGNVDELARQSGGQAYEYLQSILGRNTDMYGMQARADEAFERAKLDDDERRRRGMLGI